MTNRKLANRWMSLIQAEERNARVLRWWDAWLRGDRSRRVRRMRGINRACHRTEDVAYGHQPLRRRA